MFLWWEACDSCSIEIKLFASICAPNSPCCFKYQWAWKDSTCRDKAPSRNGICGGVCMDGCSNSTMILMCSSVVHATHCFHVFAMFWCLWFNLYLKAYPCTFWSKIMRSVMNPLDVRALSSHEWVFYIVFSNPSFFAYRQTIMAWFATWAGVCKRGKVWGFL